MATIDEFNRCIRWNTQLERNKAYGVKKIQATPADLVVIDCPTKYVARLLPQNWCSILL